MRQHGDAEATYQVWFAHYLISLFGIDRVAREPASRTRTSSQASTTLLLRDSRLGMRFDVIVLDGPGLISRIGGCATVTLIHSTAVVSTCSAISPLSLN